MFEIGLQVTHILDSFSLDNYLAKRLQSREEATLHDFDCILGLTTEICGRLQDLNIVEFIVRGFGPDPWKVDVWYDLPTIVEQIPGILEWIDNDNREVFELDFFAQGTERSLLLTVKDGQVEIECESRIDWHPDPKIEMSDLAVVDQMFSQVLTTFVSESKRYFPDLIESAYFAEWRQIPPIKRRLGA